MTALYIANPTNQRQIVCYRLDYASDGTLNENRVFQAAKQQEIGPGQQVILGRADFHLMQVEDIVKQLTPYGLVATKDTNRLNPGDKVNYVFNVDKAVPADVMRKVIFHNQNVMVEQGRDRRAKAAVATNDIVQNTVQNQFLEQGIPAQPADNTAVSFEQEEQTEAGERRIEEGYEIVPEGKVGIRSGRQAARAARRAAKSK